MDATTDITDEAVAREIQKGNNMLLGVIIDRYEKKLTRYIGKFTSNTDNINDLVQDVFIKCYTNIQSFDTKQKFSSWIYRIAHNESVNFLKKKKSLPFSWFSTDSFIPNIRSPEIIEETIITNETRKQVEHVLSQLPENHREILILYFFEELSYNEISDILRVPVSSVGVKISRAKKVLAPLLEKNNVR
jgi:RNA polymerase sigma-70 factor (ECF subfamily)